MGKNYKEQAAYDYIHDSDKYIKPKWFWSIINKWRRHNGDVAEERMIRSKHSELELDKELNVELTNYYNGKNITD